MTLYSELAQITSDGWPARAAARFAAATASRAARDAARSASAAASSRSARSAASRSARSAAAAARAARSAAAAAADAARGALSIRRSEYPEEEERLRRIRTGTVPTRELEPGFDVTEKDLESDEAVWALYEQWCKLYDKERDGSEMARRFSRFKRSAWSVLSYNRAFEGEKHTGLGEFADGMDAQEVAERKRKAALRPGGPDPTELLYIDGLAIDDSPDQSPAHGSSPSSSIPE